MPAKENNGVPPGFKMTELGLVPEEWEVKDFGSIAEPKYGKAKPKGSGDVPVIGSGGIYAWTDKALTDSPTLVIGRKGTAGKVWLEEKGCWPSDTTFYLEWLEDYCVDPYFVYQYMRLKPLSGEHAKTTLPSLTKPDLKRYLLPLPPLPEQKAIARVLRTVQRAREATEGVIAAARELKKSLMHYLFTYGPVPVTEAEQVPLKETEIGSMPEEWEVVRLKEVLLKTKQVNPRKTPDWRFKYIDVSGISRTRLSIQGYSEYEGKDAPSRARKLIEENDVIFATVRPYLKRVALVPSFFNGHICSTAFCVLRANAEFIDSPYLFYVTSDDGFVGRISEHQRGSSYPAVTDTDVKSESIRLPSIAEQRKIAEVLSTADGKIEIEEARRAALDELFKSLLEKLMTGKVRVAKA